ncbi:MAG: YdeI/OmpD-associated family protein [Bacteroidota bacterium]
MQKKQTVTFCPASSKQWKQWLKDNHQTTQSVWLILYKQSSGKPVISWSDAVDEALCFGWIDSTRRPVDDEKFVQFFCKRKPAGTWSKINKEKVEKLIAAKRMTKAGLQSIETAKQNGSWTILDAVEALTIPKDLEKAFKTNKGSKKYFMGLSKSVKKMMLQWLVLAKQPATRQKRMTEIVTLAAKQTRPQQFL